MTDTDGIMKHMKKKRHTLSYLLTPDYMFDTFDRITPEFLRSLGISALLIDIDNTLAPYEQPDPDDRIRAWFASLAENGIKVAFHTSIYGLVFSLVFNFVYKKKLDEAETAVKVVKTMN